MTIGQFQALLRQQVASAKADALLERVRAKHYGDKLPRFTPRTDGALPAAGMASAQARARGKRKLLAPQVAQTETQVQAAIVKALREAGYVVLETSQRRASGVTIGLPDLFVGRRASPCFAALEVKANEKARRSPEQIALAEAGLTTFVWTVDMAMEAVRKVLG